MNIASNIQLKRLSDNQEQLSYLVSGYEILCDYINQIELGKEEHRASHKHMLEWKTIIYETKQCKEI